MSAGETDRLERLADVLLAWLPFLVAFAVVPVAIYLPNQIEFDYRPAVLLPFLGVAALWLLAAASLWWAPAERRSRIARALFFVGLFLLLTDIVAPLEWGLLDGASELEEPFRNTAFEALVIAVLVLAWFKLPKQLVRTFGAPLVGVLFLSQAASLAFGLEEPPRSLDAEPRTAPLPTTPDDRPRPNIYHVVLDGYTSTMFLDAVEETGVGPLLDGFTFFERALANYQLTDASLPSFFTGTFYESGSFRDWQEKARTGGIRRTLQDAGYEISVYVPDRTRYWMYEGASTVVTSKELTREQFRGIDIARLAQITAVRLAPNVLRRATLRQSDEFLWQLVSWANDLTYPGSYMAYEFYKRLSVPLFEEFLEDEPGRPAEGQYVYVHLMLPHPPYSWDAECRFSRRSNYRIQTLCATRLIERFLRDLRRLERFEEALVLIHSDHGFHNYHVGPMPLTETPEPRIAEAVDAALDYTGFHGFLQRIHALLLVKRPVSELQPLKMSTAPAQLADIPATILASVDLERSRTEGAPLFELVDVQQRDIQLFAGMNAKGSDFVHLSYGLENTWRSHPPVPMQIE